MKPTKKISKTFIGFLIASIFIWLLITFSKEYTTVINFPVEYVKIEQNKLLQEVPLKEIGISVKASGFKLVGAKINPIKIQLNASNLQRKSISKFYFLPKYQVNNIQKQLTSKIVLQEILQDTIYLNLGVLASKKVPLKPNFDINYHIGYDLINDILIDPDSVIISGPENQINNIKFLNTNSLVLNDVRSDFNNTLEVIKPKNADKLKIDISDIKVFGKVEKFTEGSFKVPFEIKNLPKEVSLTSLAKEVEVVFVVALSNFNKVNAFSFKIECDYAISEKNNLGYLIPKIVEKPDFLKSYRVLPAKIDFLIQK
ncbi:hypothetical protein [uncultured Polaribacter sp.]|uniref:hypothetical protein n=1 Tax=uncultured Polaribacter sp. TaxID=174711 RepID=UPI002638F44A|nr:hypothetical protein [uncultured Polaribacter sp.]